jgi:acetoin utilization protein AcuB
MFVQDVMQAKVVTVTPRTTLPEAIRLASHVGVRHLPVVEGGRLVGIVSDRDLKRAMASSATSLEVHELYYLLARVSMEEIMTRAVITVGPTAPVEEAARLMAQEKIGALPVTEGERLLGIVTETDVLRLFVGAMGAGEPSTRLDVALGERPSALGDVVRTIESAGATVSSIVTLPSPNGARTAAVRVRTINAGPVVRALETAGFTAREAWRT